MKPWYAVAILLLAGCAAPGGEPAADSAATPQVEATNLLVKDLEGNLHDLDAVLAGGETVALVFWQTWCEACERDAPALAKAVSDNEGEIRFYGIIPGRNELVDDRQVANKAESLGFKFPQIRDRKLVLTRRFEVEGTPTIIILRSIPTVLFRGHLPPDTWEAFYKAPPSGEKPAPGEGGEKPSAETPSGKDSSAEKPSGENPSGEKPSSEVPSGAKPAKEKPAGG